MWDKIFQNPNVKKYNAKEALKCQNGINKI